jgi:hypothetical protein
LIAQILNEVKDLDIAGYLKQEIEKFLWFFHAYKLNNIISNIDFLKDYLLFLDHKSTKQIHNLDYDNTDNIDIWEHDLHYYVSKKWLNVVWENKIKQKIWQSDFNLASVMLGIKWFLLLTMDEFCNATPTRLSINKLMWDNEMINEIDLEENN